MRSGCNRVGRQGVPMLGQVSSLFLKTWICPPTLLHYFFSWSLTMTKLFHIHLYPPGWCLNPNKMAGLYLNLNQMIRHF
jgi:hypothetical protein